MRLHFLRERYTPRILRMLVWLLLLPLGCYLALVASLWLLQRRIIYPATRCSLQEAEFLAPHRGFSSWRNEQGELLGWMPTKQPIHAKARLLVLHGNAGWAGDRDYLLRCFSSALWKIYLLEYPGYGPRPGTSTENNLVRAAQEAVEWMQREGAGPIVLLGESLGTGVAGQVVAQIGTQVDALILITPMTSLREVAHHHYPFMPSWMLRDTYDARKGWAQFRGPTALVVADQDEVIPKAIGLDLYDSLVAPKKLWLVKGARHNTLPFHQDQPWKEIVNWIGARLPLKLSRHSGMLKARLP